MHLISIHTLVVISGNIALSMKTIFSLNFNLSVVTPQKFGLIASLRRKKDIHYYY